jgi:hypothetical protein
MKDEEGWYFVNNEYMSQDRAGKTWKERRLLFYQ